MTKKELLESEGFKALPDDAEIVFKTSKHPEAWTPLTAQQCWFERRCTNIDYIRKAPINVRDRITPKYKCFFIINAMPFDYMENKLHMTFDL